MPRIIVMSDGTTWERVNGDTVTVLTITDEGLAELESGADPSQLESYQILEEALVNIN